MGKNYTPDDIRRAVHCCRTHQCNAASCPMFLAEKEPTHCDVHWSKYINYEDYRRVVAAGGDVDSCPEIWEKIIEGAIEDKCDPLYVALLAAKEMDYAKKNAP